ncbi:MAG: hypothetical protein L7T84_11305 [Akkermansiaceae bacterium]|nr:hypothetical protein [Akkermansiaceae bacterium]MDB2429591.1 hypothetical protein [Akkermansiaceae bacterium]
MKLRQSRGHIPTMMQQVAVRRLNIIRLDWNKVDLLQQRRSQQSCDLLREIHH